MKLPTRNFGTSKGILKYDLYQLFTEIKNRSIIWQKSGRNRMAVDSAWYDISRILVPYFGQLNKNEQTTIVNYFKTTWRSCLDVMMKTYRQRQLGNRDIPVYRHARQFEFFLESRGLKLEDIATAEELHELDNLFSKRKPLSGDESEQNNSKTNSVPPSSKRSKPDISKTTTTLEIRQSSPNILNESNFDKIKIVKTNSESDDDNDDSVGEVQDEPKYNYYQQNSFNDKSVQIAVQKNDDADQAFFNSLKPSLHKMNESQKLDFKIQVLKILRKYQIN